MDDDCYVMTPQRLAEIELDLGDDDSGWLIKSSSLQWLIEREVNRELKNRIVPPVTPWWKKIMR